MEKIIALACDHGGFSLKEEIKKHFDEKGIKYIDLGCDSEKSVDYPVYAAKLCENLLSGGATLGILCCGTGIGMSIAANKFDTAAQRRERALPRRKGRRTGARLRARRYLRLYRIRGRQTPETSRHDFENRERRKALNRRNSGRRYKLFPEVC